MLSDSARAEEVRAAMAREEAIDARPLLERRDIMVTALVVVLWLVGLLLPERRWWGWADRLSRRRLAATAKLSADEVETVKVVVGGGPEKAAWIEDSFRRDWLAHKYRSWIELLACYRPWPWRSWSWRPRPKLIGRQHLDEALAGGRGVILFTANFVYKDLMSKAALADSGYWASHLVRDSHGFAESRLGRKLLNPLYAGIERRFLRERLVYSGTDTKAVNQRIRERLAENRLLLVTVTPLGRRVSVLPFLYGRIKIATGALNFACEAGAKVLPVFTIRKPDGTVETIIEHALDMPAGAAREDMIRTMLEDYVPRLETYAAQYPEQFAFPTSDRHGRALIEPWTSSSQKGHRAGIQPGPQTASKPEGRPTAPARPPVAAFTKGSL